MGVVEADDVADVVPVEGFDLLADGCVVGGVDGSGECLVELVDVDADAFGGLSFDGARVPEALL